MKCLILLAIIFKWILKITSLPKKIFDEANMEWKAFQPRHKETANFFEAILMLFGGGGWIKIHNFEN